MNQSPSFKKESLLNFKGGILNLLFWNLEPSHMRERRISVFIHVLLLKKNNLYNFCITKSHKWERRKEFTYCSRKSQNNISSCGVNFFKRILSKN